MITPSYKWHLKQYCKEYWKIENYDIAFKEDFKGWNCHHRLEVTLDGENVHDMKSLDRLGMYYDRPYFELIFLRTKEHNDLHGKLWKKGQTFTEEHKENLAKAHTGMSMEPRSDFGKKYKEHYGIRCSDDFKQYHREHEYYRKHHKCSWE